MVVMLIMMTIILMMLPYKVILILTQQRKRVHDPFHPKSWAMTHSHKIILQWVSNFTATFSYFGLVYTMLIFIIIVMLHLQGLQVRSSCWVCVPCLGHRSSSSPHRNINHHNWGTNHHHQHQYNQHHHDNHRNHHHPLYHRGEQIRRRWPLVDVWGQKREVQQWLWRQRWHGGRWRRWGGCVPSQNLKCRQIE